MKWPRWVNSLGLSLLGWDSIPELRGLDPEDAYQVVVDALQARNLEKDQAIYRSVVEGRGVLVGAVLFVGWYAPCS